MILTIPRALPSWNQFYAGSHWTSRHKLARLWHALVAAQVTALGKHPSFGDNRVRIIITRHGARAIDPDNVCAKLVIDGLVRACVLLDDTPLYVESVTTRSCQTEHGMQYTTIEIEECGE